MTIRRILQLEIPEDAERLRRRSVKVRRMDAGVKALIADLLDTFCDQPAYGLAAPQIGEFFRVVVIALGENREPHVLVNPEILRVTPEEIKDYDGCLSIPGIYGDTRRASGILLRGRDAEGHPWRRKLEGFDARVAQHEVDHLDGVLFIDRMDDLSELYTLQTVPSTAEGAEPTLEEMHLEPEVMALMRRQARPLPAGALRW